jgi:hypothetical protein
MSRLSSTPDDKTLAAVMKRYGVKPSAFAAATAPEPVRDWREWVGVKDEASVRELGEALGDARVTELDEDAEGEPVELADLTPDEQLAWYVPGADELDPSKEIGTPGTPLTAGVLRVDPSYRLTPFLARGHANNLGVYEDHLRDPLVYQCFQTITQLLITGQWSMAISELAQEWMTPAQLEVLEAEVDTIWGALLNLEDGWPSYIQHAVTAVIFGFSIFEVVWGKQDARGPLPSRLAYREAATVDQWLMTQRQDKLLAVRFITGSPGSTYVLPAWGATLTARRVLINTLGGRGNNFEGIPPTRPIDFLITFKRLLLTIIAAGAERFSSPILVSRVDAALLNIPGFNPEQGQWTTLGNILESLRALETPTLAFPPGLMAEYLGPPGTMPDLMALVTYCDQQIMLAFSNQGSLLGQNSHGSYALAETQDNQLLRSAPYYAETITRSLNRLIRDLFIARGWRLPQYPEVRWQIGGAADASRLLTDLATFMRDAKGWPRAAQQMGLKMLGLPPDTFEAADAYRSQTTGGDRSATDQAGGQGSSLPSQGAASELSDHGHRGVRIPLTLAESFTPPKGVRDNAARALAVRAEKPESERGMTGVGIARARDLSNGRPVSEDTVRRMLAYFDRHQGDKDGETWSEQGKGWQAWMGWGGDEGWRWARRIVDRLDRARTDNAEDAHHHHHHAGCATCDDDLEEGADEVQGLTSLREAGGTLTALAEEDWPASAALMDEAELALAAALAKIQRAQQARWKELIRDNTTSADVVADRDQIRSEFRPRYIAAVREVMADVGAEAARMLARQIGISGELPPFISPAELDLLAANVGDEITSRSISLMSSAQVERARGSSRVAVPVLGAAAVAFIASKAISGAYNAGRGQLVMAIIDRLRNTAAGSRPGASGTSGAGAGTVRMMAERSAVMDSGTCEPCRTLDGVQVLVGSKRYRDLSPPNRCAGGERCRCVWIYRVPEDVAAAISAIGGLK